MKTYDSRHVVVVCLDFDRLSFCQSKDYFAMKKEGTAGELMHEWFPKYPGMGRARMKRDKETDEEGKKRGASEKRSKAGTKKRKSRRPITS